ncbi:MAG: hypothetical protein K8S21_11545 [Gemmatimonadetes bacterium]|nr:hypothetical protein [Gemmatimonadota bacterium]
MLPTPKWLTRAEFARARAIVTAAARVLLLQPFMRALRELVAVFDLVIGPSLGVLAHVAFAALVFLVAAGPYRGCSGARAYTTVMRSDLRNIVTAQEAHFAEHARYASVLSPDEYRHSTGVELVSLDVGAMGFVAVMAYPGRTKQRCTLIYRRGIAPIPTCEP